MKKTLSCLAVGTAALTIAACSNNETVATTNAGNVTKVELYDAMKLSSGNQALYTLLVEKVAMATVTDKAALEQEVNTFIASRKTSAGGDEAFLKSIKTYGYETEIAFRKAVYANRAIYQAIKEKTTISDDDVTKAYETWEPNMKASHILVDDEATAKDIINQLNSGGDWNALATKHSKDKSNSNKGGSLGEFKPSSMVAEFANAVKTMKDGEISQAPIKTKFGYHIVKMESNPPKGSLEEVKETIRKDLINTKVNDKNHQQAVLKDLLKAANVQVNDAFLKTAIAKALGQDEAASTTAAPSSSQTETTTKQSSSGN